MTTKTGSNDIKIISIIVHLSGILSGLILPLIVPLAILIATENKYLKLQCKKALNWQISLFIYMAITGILIAISVLLMILLIGFILAPIFGLLLFLLYVVNIIFSIIAAIKANEGIAWEYPFSIPFLK
ncbi:MAG: DUF4870 domain-containing protein [Nanoarchaeota archaeon]|nr:DUF4870 domain-containing protein [Nanoarchaeota archaeon]